MKIIEDLQYWWQDLTFSTTQKRSLLVIGAIALTISGAYVLRPTAANEIERAPVLETQAINTQITVDVAGAVANPGVYALDANSRVVDAITAAGQILKGADTSDLNLARIMKDGEQIYVYPKATSFTRSGTSTRATPVRRGPIAINRASAKELEALDGIGPVLASRIVTYRSANGPFAAVEDLLKVSGIGAAKFAQFKEKIRV
jgi:competence protein ComEA